MVDKKGFTAAAAEFMDSYWGAIETNWPKKLSGYINGTPPVDPSGQVFHSPTDFVLNTLRNFKSSKSESIERLDRIISGAMDGMNGQLLVLGSGTSPRTQESMDEVYRLSAVFPKTRRTLVAAAEAVIRTEEYNVLSLSNPRYAGHIRLMSKGEEIPVNTAKKKRAQRPITPRTRAQRRSP
jgi:hypothetical protein